MEDIFKNNKQLKNCFGVIFHLTDTYFISESKIGRKIDLPGFARLYRILEILSKNYLQGRGKILFLHSGDFLFPSFLSNYFNGQQMIDTLNRCCLNYCTLGNHDFDGGLGILEKRISESKFGYIVTNLLPPKSLTSKIHQYAIWPNKSPKIAILGIAGKMTSDRALENGFQKSKLKHSLKKSITKIKNNFPDIKFLVVLSHMDDFEDLALKKWINNMWPYKSVILGGHNHNELFSFSPKKDRCILLKGQSNFRTSRIIILDDNLDDKNSDLAKNVILLNSKVYDKINPSKVIESRVKYWFDVLEKKKLLPKKTIVKQFSKGVLLGCTELSLREGTTNFGNFITDCIRDFTKTDISFINSGHFRSDRYFYEKITLFDLANTFVMKKAAKIMIIDLSKKECLTFLKHAYLKPGKGKILQFSKNTLKILREKKMHENLRVALISDMILGDDDGFAEILAKSRKISINKLRNLLKNNILKNTDLIKIIEKQSDKVQFDPSFRMLVRNFKLI